MPTPAVPASNAKPRRGQRGQGLCGRNGQLVPWQRGRTGLKLSDQPNLRAAGPGSGGQRGATGGSRSAGPGSRSSSCNSDGANNLGEWCGHGGGGGSSNRCGNSGGRDDPRDGNGDGGPGRDGSGMRDSHGYICGRDHYGSNEFNRGCGGNGGHSDGDGSDQESAHNGAITGEVPPAARRGRSTAVDSVGSVALIVSVLPPEVEVV